MGSVEQVQKVLSSYANIINRREWEGTAHESIVSTFSPMLRRQTACEVSWLRRTCFFQVHSPALIEVRGKSAAARSGMREACEIERDGVRIGTHGIYDDELHCEGMWRFTNAGSRSSIFDSKN